ncbi:hypothetical protein D3C78_1363020 [compost metagenome]
MQVKAMHTGWQVPQVRGQQGAVAILLKGDGADGLGAAISFHQGHFDCLRLGDNRRDP